MLLVFLLWQKRDLLQYHQAAQNWALCCISVTRWPMMH
jgi:hypothetical protein